MTRPELLALVASALPGFGSQAGTEQDPLHATLKLGEIIRGRVMRSLGEGRYAVSFRGHERVVDSAVPLKREEILHGRVVALGDRVELQRVRAEAAPAPDRDAAQDDSPTAPAAATADLQPLLASWTAAERAALARLLAEAPDREAALLAARAVARSTLPGSTRLVQAVYAALASGDGRGIFPVRSDALVLEHRAPDAADVGAAPVAAAMAVFAEALKASFDASRPSRARAGDAPARDEPRATAAEDEFAGGSDAAYGGDAAAAFFNAQTGGAVAHAVATLPLIVDGRLIELDVALFGEPRDGGGAMPHGRVVIELETERLGRLHVDARLVGTHVHIGIASDIADAADFIARHAGTLRSRMQADGWIVDGLRYEVREREGTSGVARVVLEHRVSADSLSRLI
jgi:flagellar hook-length control protein FliK